MSTVYYTDHWRFGIVGSTCCIPKEIEKSKVIFKKACMEYPQPKSSLAVLIGAYRALIKPSFLLLKHACILTQKRKGCIPLSSYRRSKNNTLCYLTKIWPTVGLLLPFSSSNGPALYYSARQVERRCDNRIWLRIFARDLESYAGYSYPFYKYAMQSRSCNHKFS